MRILMCFMEHYEIPLRLLIQHWLQEAKQFIRSQYNEAWVLYYVLLYQFGDRGKKANIWGIINKNTINTSIKCLVIIHLTYSVIFSSLIQSQINVLNRPQRKIPRCLAALVGILMTCLGTTARVCNGVKQSNMRDFCSLCLKKAFCEIHGNWQAWLFAHAPVRFYIHVYDHRVIILK